MKKKQIVMSKLEFRRGPFLKCPGCDKWYCCEDSLECSICHWNGIEVMESEDDIGTCPSCGWESNDYEKWIIGWSEAGSDVAAEMLHGGRCDYWTETWFCKECGTIFKFQNSSY